MGEREQTVMDLNEKGLVKNFLKFVNHWKLCYPCAPNEVYTPVTPEAIDNALIRWMEGIDWNRE